MRVESQFFADSHGNIQASLTGNDSHCESLRFKSLPEAVVGSRIRKDAGIALQVGRVWMSVKIFMPQSVFAVSHPIL